jgi:dTDP-4-amino-4,6-dideoxygalactose transaminase
MPSADELLPLLREIDEKRQYSNNGPLVQRLAARLSAMTRSRCAVVSNGTHAIELALRALDLPRGANVLVPAVTFSATAQAVINARLTPVIVDVDAGSWQLHPAHALQLSQISAVLPVAAFGLPVLVAPWERFSDSTGLPVVIDAAGAIYGQEVSARPSIVTVFSLHATKSLGAGEGGFVASRDQRLIDRVASLAAFGPGGTNAKMSEYHAAVALASMRRNESGPNWRPRVFRDYAFGGLPESVEMQDGIQPMRTLLPVLLPTNAQDVAAEMLARGIETKRWYAPFLNERPEFGLCPQSESMPVTDALRDRLLGLPFHAFLTEGDVARVCAALRDAIARTSTETTANV